jgi:hypothetical protein
MIGPMVGTPGSGSGGGDLAPTAQQIAVNGEFKQQLAQIRVEVNQLINQGTAAVSAMLQQAGSPAIKPR